MKMGTDADAIIHRQGSGRASNTYIPYIPYIHTYIHIGLDTSVITLNWLGRENHVRVPYRPSRWGVVDPENFAKVVCMYVCMLV